MHHRTMLSFYGLIIAIMAFSAQANAVSLGKIDVASHLGEPFYAEVPLTLDEGEVISSVFVELAAPSDYRILEVYRDQALNVVRADVESDSRGSRVELTSRTVVDAPFFNLVLKVRYGRATHYKKYPVFLDLPRAAQPLKKAASLPSVSVEDVREEPVVATVSPVKGLESDGVQVEKTADGQSSEFKSFEGWARTSHYGPMVYGDTISTVADRLRVDNRYSRNQVMVALFEKNRSKFEQDNINMVQAGTHLDVPMADEVERIRPDQARSIMNDHNQRWKELVKQPRYAAVAEAQRTRYSKRVNVGKRATGVSVAPVSGQQGQADETPSESVAEPAAVSGTGSVDGAVDGQIEAESSALADSISKLQKDNEELQVRLAESDAKLAKLSATGPADAQVAAEARIKKLELQLARLQSELDSAKQSSVEGPGVDWLTLLGGGLVVLLLGGGAGYLMRRERKHPAMEQASETIAVDSFEDAPIEPAAPEEIEVEAVEEFTSDATEQMNTDEFENAFTDSIPDLTDEETGEMEAFKEDLDEEPDPNVDYLSEADVYMRYGMEDEAEKQVTMALKVKENNKDAHVKMVQIRKSRGDEAGADEAISTARMVLSDDALSTFDSTIASLTTGGSSADVASMEDTLPPGALDVSSDPQVEEGLEDAATDLSGLEDIEFGDEEEITSKIEVDASADDEKPETLDLGDLELPADETPDEAVGTETERLDTVDNVNDKSAEKASGESASDDSEGLDFDLSGLELPDDVDATSESAIEESSEAGLKETGEVVEPVSEEMSNESAEKMDDDGLNLSDLDFPSATDADSTEDSDDDMMTADLDKTIVMDWSKETVTTGDHDAGGESGAGEIEFDEDEPSTEDATEDATEDGADTEADSEDKNEEAAIEEEKPEENEPEENLTSIEFDLEDLDVDLDAPVDSDDVDDFSSTIQTSVGEINKDGVFEAADKSDTVDLGEGETEASFGLEPLDEDAGLDTDENAISPTGLGDGSQSLGADNASLEELIEKSEDKDFDATMELDSLLTELGSLDEDEASSDDKKESDKGDS
ncbi:MAG: FimV/HubP family polar landmark protein [Mariprofundaceae bacterium]